MIKKSSKNENSDTTNQQDEEIITNEVISVFSSAKRDHEETRYLIYNVILYLKKLDFIIFLYE